MNQQELPLFESLQLPRGERAHVGAESVRSGPSASALTVGRSMNLLEIEALSRRAGVAGNALRSRLLAPSNTKVAPTLTARRAAQVLGMAASDTSCSTEWGLRGFNRGRWTVAEIHDAARRARQAHAQAARHAAVVIAVCHTKGGVGKTTTSMSLAQGLSLLGHRVLAVDADPQGSLSMLFGLLPEADVPESATLFPVLRGDLGDALEVARPTYWPNIDLIPASPTLFGVEYSLYAMAIEHARGDFLTALDRSLDSARHRYDVIIIDTPPSLSCLTINALLAANCLIVPLPPTALDFNSLAQLWALLSEIGQTSNSAAASGRCFDFVHILPTRVDRTDAAARVVLRWMEDVYGDLVMPFEIPKTVATSRASAEFGTVFDVCDRSCSTRAHQRAQIAYDQLVAVIDSSITQVWRKQAIGGQS